MESRKQGRRPAESRPDFDGIDEHEARPHSSRSPQRSEPSSDQHVLTERTSAEASRDQRSEPLVTDSHVLGGNSQSSTKGSSSQLPLLIGPHRSESGSGFPSSLNLHLSDSQTLRPPSPQHRNRQDAGVTQGTLARSTGDRRRWGLILLASYASAVTLACLYLITMMMQSRSHELENLPDVEPLDANEFRYIPENASLPAGHTLPLGQQQQFGHILVEPLRIIRQPLEYVHFSGNRKLKHERTAPVLQLWVRFTNLSKDQRIVPLDRLLLFKRDYNDESSQLLTNNFIRSAHTSGVKSPVVPMLDHPLSSEWDIRDQHLGDRLAPGESVEMFLPSQPEGIHSLEGSFLWRMHFRKGFHHSTGHGVTTLVDVAFDTQEIEQTSTRVPTGNSQRL